MGWVSLWSAGIRARIFRDAPEAHRRYGCMPKHGWASVKPALGCPDRGHHRPRNAGPPPAGVRGVGFAVVRGHPCPHLPCRSRGAPMIWMRTQAWLGLGEACPGVSRPGPSPPWERRPPAGRGPRGGFRRGPRASVPASSLSLPRRTDDMDAYPSMAGLRRGLPWGVPTGAITALGAPVPPPAGVRGVGFAVVRGHPCPHLP